MITDVSEHIVIKNQYINRMYEIYPEQIMSYRVDEFIFFSGFIRGFFFDKYEIKFTVGEKVLAVIEIREV